MNKIITLAPRAAFGAMAATEFRKIREENDLPVATPSQIDQAKIRAVGQYRHYNTPVGLQMFALNMPLSRIERRKLIADGKLEKQKPAQNRGDNIQVEVTAEMAQETKDRFGCKTMVDYVQACCSMFRYAPSELPRIMKRVERWANSKSERMPEHIRQKSIFLSLIAEGQNLEGLSPA